MSTYLVFIYSNHFYPPAAYPDCRIVGLNCTLADIYIIVRVYNCTGLVFTNIFRTVLQ